jgi:glycosyltransferase domain-containing protein
VTSAPQPTLSVAKEPGALLTLVVLVRDTPQYISRWLRWGISQQTRFEVIVADGSRDDACAHAISALMPAMPQLRYLRYPQDSARAIFYAKIVKTLDEVRTPFVSVLADDDLPWFPGFERAIASLASNPDAVSARGRIHDFECQPEPSAVGAQSLLWRWYEMDQELLIPDWQRRLRLHFTEYCLTYHDVVRTSIARTIFRGQLDLGIFDPNLAELFLSGLLVRQGVVVRLDHPFLFRASRPNSVSARMSTQLDSFDELFQSGWMEQYDRLLNAIGSGDPLKTGSPGERHAAHRSLRRFLAPLIIRALGHDIAHSRFKVSYTGPVRPFDPLPGPPDAVHASAAAEVMKFLGGLL